MSDAPDRTPADLSILSPVEDNSPLSFPMYITVNNGFGALDPVVMPDGVDVIFVPDRDITSSVSWINEDGAFPETVLAWNADLGIIVTLFAVYAFSNGFNNAANVQPYSGTDDDVQIAYRAGVEYRLHMISTDGLGLTVTIWENNAGGIPLANSGVPISSDPLAEVPIFVGYTPKVVNTLEYDLTGMNFGVHTFKAAEQLLLKSVSVARAAPAIGTFTQTAELDLTKVSEIPIGTEVGYFTIPDEDGLAVVRADDNTPTIEYEFRNNKLYTAVLGTQLTAGAPNLVISAVTDKYGAQSAHFDAGVTVVPQVG